VCLYMALFWQLPSPRMDRYPASGDDSHRQFYSVGGGLVDLAIGSASRENFKIKKGRN